MAENHGDKPPVTDAEIRAEVEKVYGFMSWALDHPELGPILYNAAREGWDEARLKGAIEGTVWFRTNTESARAFDEEEATDPASARRKVEATARLIIDTGKRLGVNITTERANALARNAVRNGLTEPEIEQAVRQEFRYKPDQTIDTGTGRLAFVGPNGEPGWSPEDPNKPANAVEHTMEDGRKAFYLPGDFDPTDNMANSGGRPELLAAQAEQVGRGVVLAPGTVFAPNPGGADVLIDVRTGRPAFRGPNGEAGYDPNDPNKPEGGEVWTMPDGRQVYFIRSQANPRTVSTSADPLAPAAQTLEQELKDIAIRDYLLPMPESEIGRWVTDIIQGKTTVDQFKVAMRAQAVSMWPQFKAAIEAGQTVRQFLANYGGIVERELGIPYEQIDWQDPKWRRAIFKPDANGAVGVMDLFEWEQMLKSDETYGWDKTPNGRDQWASMATALTSILKGVR